MDEEQLIHVFCATVMHIGLNDSNKQTTGAMLEYLTQGNWFLVKWRKEPTRCSDFMSSQVEQICPASCFFISSIFPS